MLLHPPYPGEILENYLGDMTVKKGGQRCGVTRPNLSRILNGRAGISAVISARRAKTMPYTSPEFWLKLQLNYDLWKAKKNRLPRIKPFPVRLRPRFSLTLTPSPTEERPKNKGPAAPPYHRCQAQ